MTTKFHGVIPPVVTPLTPNGDLDVASYEKLINRFIGQGVDGLFVLGSTSEVAFFDDEMRGRVLSEAKRIIDGRVPLLAGVIDTETLRVIRHIGQAEEIGVDAVVDLAIGQRVQPLGPEEVPSAEKPWTSVQRELQADVWAPRPFQERLEPDGSSERWADERVVDEATAFARAGDAFGQHHFCLQRREGACEELAWVHVHVADDDERDRDELHEERDRTRLVDVDATHADACSEVERDDRNGDLSKSDQAEDPVVALGELLGWTAAGRGDGRGERRALIPSAAPP